MGRKEDQAYIEALIAHLSIKPMKEEKRRLLDLWEKTDLLKDPELSKLYIEQYKEVSRRLDQLYEEERKPFCNR